MSGSDAERGANATDEERADLERRLLAWMREPEWKPDEARFDALARAVFAHQYARCEPYRRLCQARGVAPDALQSWRAIPTVPTGAFKEAALRSFPPDRTCKTFRTSGTATARRGALHLDTLALYEASLRASFERFVLAGLAPGARLRMHVLAPSAAELPDSSLSHMFQTMLDARGAPGSRFWLGPGALDAGALRAALEADAASGEPVLLAGTAFAFVHALDAWSGAPPLALAAGSRVLETGGFKGRSRELTRNALHAALAEALGLARERVVNQYGMTELGSQFYDSVLREPDAPRRKLAPPWTRVRVLDPASGRELGEGQRGVLAIHDLANLPSVAAIQTADVGRRLGDGFEVLGREPGAEARGCSIAADLMLGGASATS